MSEFNGGHMLGPSFRVVGAIDPEICFDFLICSLRLAVSLRVVGSGKFRGDVEKVTEFLEGFGSKLRAPVGDDHLGQAEPSEKVVKEKLGSSYRICCFIARG